MKQSTKLLSLVLALVMAFSCMTVIGNAKLVKSEIVYDSIDDSALTPEQVADIALDLVDGLLKDADIVLDITVAEIDLRSVDRAFETLNEVGRGTLLGIASAIVNLGVIEELNFDALGPSSSQAYQRSNGDLVIIKQLLQFLADNATKISPVAYGIETSNGLSLGLIGNFVDLGDIQTMLSDIPGLVKDMVYDMLLYGSYSHPLDAEELEAAGQSLPYNENIDDMLTYAVLNLLTTPQDYDWVGEGAAAEKVWDENSILLPGVKAYQDAAGDAYNYLNLKTKSVFDVLDVLAQFAIDDLGVSALNNNLKKSLMEAVEVEFNEINDTDVPADVKAIFDNEAAYVTYIAYDCLEKSAEDGEWYYTTLKTEVETDSNGDPVLDEEGNEVSSRVRKYFKANSAIGNDFYELINWDYEILRSDAEGAGDLNSINYNAILSEYGTLAEAINHIIYIVYETALNEDIKQEFTDMTGDGWVDGPTSENINYNIERIIKFLLARFPDKIFGSDSPYADTEVYTYDFYADMTLIDIVALIGPGFFDGVMPQLIIPVNEDGAYAFATSDGESSVALLQFAALVIREFITEIAPNVNYDAYIFDDVTSADGRQFAEHSADEWFNIILNIGMDIAYTYLYNITNFGDVISYTTDGTGFGSDAALRTTTLPDAPDSLDEATSEARWQGMLDEVIMWAVRYVGVGSNGVITGINPTAVEGKSGPFNKLSYILNTILPLGFVNGCESADYDLDVSVLFDKVKTFFTTFDLSLLASLFGRNGVATTVNGYETNDDSTLKRGNILAQPVIPMVLGLVNDILYLVFGADILPTETSLNDVLTQANLKTIIETLLTRLNAVKSSLLVSALPVVGKLIKGWGTEQAFDNPSVSLDKSITLTAGATTEAQTVTVANGSDGVWRHWRNADGTEGTDEQYAIKLTGVSVFNIDGTACTKVTPTITDTDGEDNLNYIDYGETGAFTYTATGISSPGQVVRFDISYQVYEGTTLMTNETYTTSIYSYLNYDGGDEGTSTTSGNDGRGVEWGWYKRYVDLSNVPSSLEGATLLWFKRTTQTATGKTDFQMTGTGDALSYSFSKITLNNGDREWSVNPYKAGEYWAGGDNAGETASEDCVTNTVTFNQSTWDALNKTSGSTGSIKASISGSKKPLLFGSSTSFSGSIDATFTYYDGAARNLLTNEVNNETSMGKVKADYDLTETYYYAGSLLNSAATTTDADGNEVLKETNFADTAWVDADGELVTATVTPDADDETIGSYTADGVTRTAFKVTRINAATAWSNYQSALEVAMEAAYGVFRAGGKFNYETYLENLKVASDDLDYVEKVVTGGGLDDEIAALKTQLKNVEAATTDVYDYTDYRMYRLNRLNDARSDAQYYIDLKKDASYASVDAIDSRFPYTGMIEADLLALIAADSDLAIVGGTDNANLISALLEEMDEEEKAAQTEWLENKKLEYASVASLDVAMASSLLSKTSTRLLDRQYKVNGNADTTYLATEIESAEAMITDSSLYTERSWTKYAKALADAKAVLADGTSQKAAFDAKWELLCCRNELVLVENEADYSELEALIAQARHAMENKALYDNTAKELGQVLAELGLEAEITNADGDTVNLFPGSALYINSEPYSTEEQDVVDQKATELKEALARLKFKGLQISGANVAEKEIIAADEEAGTPAVTAKLATIAAEMNADAVKSLFSVVADNATVDKDNITVSNDLHYTVDTDLTGFAGTNSVVTFYTINGGIKIPVATVKIVVNGDLDGDGAVDVIDGAMAQLVSTDKAELSGCYFIAANLAGVTDLAEAVINADDYKEVVNVIMGRDE